MQRSADPLLLAAALAESCLPLLPAKRFLGSPRTQPVEHLLADFRTTYSKQLQIKSLEVENPHVVSNIKISWEILEMHFF